MNYNQQHNQAQYSKPNQYPQNTGQQQPYPANQYPQYQQPNQPPQSALNKLAQQGANYLSQGNFNAQGGVIAMQMPSLQKDTHEKIPQPQKDAFAELNPTFQFIREQSNVALVDLIGKKLQIRIKLNQNQNPQVLVLQLGEHPLINPIDRVVNYEKVYPWNNQFSNLLALCKILNTTFMNDPIKAEQLSIFNNKINGSPLVAQITEANQYNEIAMMQTIKDAALNVLMPGCEQQQNITPDAVISSFQSSSQYKELVTQLLNTNQLNEILNDKILQSDGELKQIIEMIIHQEEQFRQHQQSIGQKFNRVNTIQERFDKTKILKVIEKMKEDLEEQGEAFYSDHTGSIFKGDRPSSQMLDQECLQYLDLRRQFHRLSLKSEKFSLTM